jgi:hypothetical protein
LNTSIREKSVLQDVTGPFDCIPALGQPVFNKSTRAKGKGKVKGKSKDKGGGSRF